MKTNPQTSEHLCSDQAGEPEDRSSAVFKLGQVPGGCLPLPELQRQLSAGPSDDAPDFWHHVGRCLRCARAVVVLDRDVTRRAPDAMFGPALAVDPARYQGKILVAQGPTFQLFRALDRQRYAEFEVLDRRSGAEFEALGQRPAAEIMLKELPARAQLPAPGQRQLLDACLRREAGLLARLRHPSIVRLLEAGEWQRSGEAFYAMADVKGESLREAVGRARQPRQRLGLLRAFVGVADAIEYAHARGLLHRNVNPSAIVYDRGRAWATLVDWSAAKPLHRRSPRDAVFDAAELPTGGPNTAARGTIGFAAPEQASPEQDQRTDVYSLGATLHFIVTGRLPCSHNGRDSFIAKIHDDCRDESVGLPEGLSSIVTKAMAYEPADRHESAHEFVSELRRALGL